MELASHPEDYFERRFQNLVKSGDLVLDAGCGTGKFVAARRVEVCHYKIIGLDRFDRVSKNFSLDFRACGNVNQLPFLDASLDVIYGRWLVEHLEDPVIALREFYRVLKPGGCLALFTTNLMHYYGGAARLTPQWFHLWFNRRIRGFEDEDIFPTYYKANTPRVIRALLSSSGFEPKNIEIVLLEGSAEFLRFNLLLYGMATVYAKVVQRFKSLSSFRMNIAVFVTK